MSTGTSKISKRKITAAVCAMIFTAAFIAAVFLNLIFPPKYSHGPNRRITDDAEDILIEKKGRSVTVILDGEEVRFLPKGVLVQDVLFDDIDHDGKKDIAVLCWKRGKYGKKKPSWVKRDEIKWSQHIFIYRIENGRVIPRWMASDIGVRAASWEYRDKVLFITDTKGGETKWKWIHWGLEKM